ncbi:MAG: hypothetical protein ACJ8KO_01445 [Sulfurifustaceae bacterium]
MHTDAEGRRVLADTLHFAAREKPRLIVDYATLTGACIFALGTRFSGVITNRDDRIPGLIETGFTPASVCGRSRSPRTTRTC